jgi:subtilisin family serine protease
MKVLLFFILTSFLIGCDNGSDSVEPSGFVEKPGLAQCQSAQVKNKFVVVWKDGSVTKEYAKDRETFVKVFMENNKDFVKFAEHDYVVQLSPLGKSPNLTTDAYFDNWGAANIDADQAWASGAKGSGTLVAVIDSGMDISHPLLKNQIAVNNKEIPGNNIDDDKNGLVDDYSGYSFVTNDDNVSFGSLHGTHVSGIIAAEHDKNSITDETIMGVAPKTKILPLKFIDSEGGGMVSDAIAAIDYAIGRGAKIINASWGGGCSESLRIKVNELAKKNILLIAAAGNSSLDIDVDPEFPAAYATETMITVGAITRFNGLAYFSNYGEKRVHLFAPGESIISTIPDNSYETLDGTSMAAPFVSGAAAVLWGDRPNATALQIKEAILKSVVVENDAEGNPEYPNSSHGRLNLGHALAELRKMIP